MTVRILTPKQYFFKPWKVQVRKLCPKHVLDEESKRQNKRDIVHILMKRKKTFGTVTDEQGNKKFGTSTGSLEETKGRSRQSRYAAESTVEKVGRTLRKMGLKSAVIKVKGVVYFGKKRKVIMSWRDGFKGKVLGLKPGFCPCRMRHSLLVMVAD